MRLDGLAGHAHLRRDGLVGRPRREVPQHVQLAQGEWLGRRVRDMTVRRRGRRLQRGIEDPVARVHRTDRRGQFVARRALEQVARHSRVAH